MADIMNALDWAGAAWWTPIVVAPFIGSFLATLVVRLPAGEPIGWSRSHCRSCSRVLVARDLIPFLSYLLQRGRCRTCGAPIGALYPAMEAAAVLIAAWAATVIDDPAGRWAGCGLGWILLTLSAIDLRDLLLPDSLTLPLIALGLGWAGLTAPETLADHAIGSVAGFCLLALVARLYERLRGREGLGLGDAKLFAAAGAWVAWYGLPGVLLLAAGSALLAVAVRSWRRARLDPAEAVPFGPFLCLGLWLTWLYGPLGLG